MSASRRAGAATLVAVAAVAYVLPRTAAADTVSSLQAQAQAVATRLAGLDAQMARLDEQLDQAQNRVNSVRQQVDAARRAYDAAQAQVATKRAALRQDAVAAYIQGGQATGLIGLLQSSQSQAAVRQSYISAVTGAQQSDIDALRQALTTFQARQARLQADQAAAESALGAVRSARNASAAAAAAEQDQLGSVRGRLADLVAQVEAQRAAATASRLEAGFVGHGGGGAASRDSGVGPALPPPSGAGASVAVQWAQREIGKPYVYGAAGPDSFDCSGLTMYVWGQAGVGLPHSAAGQWDDTTRIPMSDLQPGDLIFYYQPVDHVGIYVGGGEMIVADHTGTNVRYASIYRDGLDGAGRVG